MATTVNGLNGTIKAAIEEIQALIDVDVVPSGKFLRDDGTWQTAGGSFAGDMDDIPDGTTYVKTENNLTDAEKTILSNTSGTNSGDNATNTQYSGLAASKQDADAQLTSIAALSYTGNALKVIRVNAGETDFELATPSGGSGISQAQARQLTRR
jgi:hypothetical protein